MTTGESLKLSKSLYIRLDNPLDCENFPVHKKFSQYCILELLSSLHQRLSLVVRSDGRDKTLFSKPSIQLAITPIFLSQKPCLKVKQSRFREMINGMTLEGQKY